MTKYFISLLLSLLLMSCERSEIAPYPTQSGLSAFRFNELNGEVLYFDSRYQGYETRSMSTIEVKGLTSSVQIAFDSVSYMPDTISSFMDHLFIYPHLYTVQANNATRLQSLVQPRWHRSYVAALNDKLMVLAGEISGSRGDSVTNLEVYRLDGNSQSVGHIDLRDPGCVALYGDVVFIADDNQLKVIDLQNPSVPSLVRSIALPSITHFSIADNKLIVTSRSEIHQFDVSDNRNPVLLAIIK